ncbi:hypothetical protein CFN78_01495 [Amycolatopsis antarctica]|uniref:Uncharacterized protein n=1 Tax=Amycolatopsis antarctica TaxID=1854586 RepID=A0A263DBN7_9PSEU|nr:hypothetical protein CFN78_01495 [Amycolatopsis antarctica]
MGLTALLLSSCAQGKTATAIPDGDDAASYVTAKFAEKLKVLGEDFTGNEARKSSLEKFGRIDDKKSDQLIEAVQVGRPPARLAKNHSKRDSNEYLDFFHPAGSPIEYGLLGPVYSSLAPTPWVSMPYDGGTLNACFWEGYQDVCKMLDAVSAAVDKGAAAKQAKSLPDGSVELLAEIPLGVFLDKRVIVFPERLLTDVNEEMKQEPVASKIVLDGLGKLRSIEMTGLIKGDGHEVEVRMNYRILEPPTENDLPKIPDPSQVTNLPDEAAVADFYDRMGEIQDR